MLKASFLAALLLMAGATSLWAQKAGASPKAATPATSLKIDFEKFKLANGLEVIFHIDRSDPIVAVALTAHVGSAREKAGRTGFAHLFEHLLFLESENLGKGGLDAMSARIGGSGANGSTNRDRTNYYQTVPKDALEKMLWAEADKLGWFINTVTEPVLAKEKQVVKNEKRQSYDNRPYGHTSYVIDKQLYPEGHPYNWQVIGSLEDVQNATLADVKEFYQRWYVPNNVTLVVAGDFDKAQARSWVQKYFGEIKKGAPVAAMPKQAGRVAQTVKLYHEDNFAALPELTLAWTGVEEYHPDAYALQVLCEYLAEGKRAPLYQVLVEEKKLTDEVSMYSSNSELAGDIQLSVRAFEGKDLDEVAAAVAEGFRRFEQTGIPQQDLDRIKATIETQLYTMLSSVEGKAFQLAQYNIFAGDPGYLQTDFKKLMAVTRDDVMRAYKRYLAGTRYVASSFVPKGETALALDGAQKAAIVEEQIVAGAEDKVDPNAKATYQRTPSTFDRSKEPPYGTSPELRIPAIWEQSLPNGMKVLGIESNEVPLVQFDIYIDGGQLLEDINKPGVANMLAKMMTQGTKRRTAEELEAAIQQLGASIQVDAGAEEIRMRVNTLARNYPATLALVEEILLEPRWDPKELELVRESTISQLQQQAANPNAIAANAYALLLYGKDNIRSRNILGTEASAKAITMEDLKAFYARSISPSVARMHVVGALGKQAIVSSLSNLANRWQRKSVEIPKWNSPQPPTKPVVYFYDVPGAKQSVIRFGYPALAATSSDYYPAQVMNYILGGGGFASRLTQQLRESKGYTYNISSSFAGTQTPGPFTIASGVRSNVTLESAQEIKNILQQYPSTFSQQDLETTKSSLIKSNARAFETATAKLSMLNNISKYGWKYDYIKDRERIVKGMSLEEIRRLSGQYLNTDRMVWLIVGDAATQLPRMKELGFGEPVVLKL